MLYLEADRCEMPEKWAGVTKVATTTVAADTKARRCAGSAHRCTDGGRWRRNDDDDDDHEQQQQQQQQPAAVSYTGTLHAYCGTRTGQGRRNQRCQVRRSQEPSAQAKSVLRLRVLPLPV